MGTALAIERNDQWLERRYLNPEELTMITLAKPRLTTTA